MLKPQKTPFGFEKSLDFHPKCQAEAKDTTSKEIHLALAEDHHWGTEVLTMSNNAELQSNGKEAPTWEQPMICQWSNHCQQPDILRITLARQSWGWNPPWWLRAWVKWKWPNDQKTGTSELLDVPKRKVTWCSKSYTLEYIRALEKRFPNCSKQSTHVFLKKT